MVDTKTKQKPEHSQSAIMNEVNRKPSEVRDKVYSMIQDQSIDSQRLSLYLYNFLFKNELTTNTPENQAFWKEIEFNFVQTYTEETDANY